jgi:hypothetical protein
LTRYLVFKNVPAPVGEVDAASANAAIRAYVAKNGTDPKDADGKFVAIPVRSFHPVSVTVERAVKIA